MGACGLELPLESFSTYKAGKFGRRSRCKRCRADEAKASRQNDPPLTQEQREAAREANLRYNKTDKGKLNWRRHNKTPKSKKRRASWAKSERGQQVLKTAHKKFCVKRRVWMQAEKVRRGCIDCGYNKHPAALDFDHVNGDKSFDVSKVSRSQSVLEAEIAKCVIRCSNCHRIKTYEARQAAKDKRRIKG